MRIPNEVIQEIQRRADIIEVIGDFVSIKKAGKDYKACCPFHNEKTPSFSISPAKGIYKCFGCGKGGDAVKFVMDIESVSYVEALKYLAKKYNIELPESAYQAPTEEEVRQQNEKESILIALNYAKDYFKEQLWQTDEGKSIGITYFKERGFNDKIIQDFELGYSVNEWSNFYKKAILKGFSPQILAKAGLIAQREGQDKEYYDLFRERVMFPIHSLAGKVVAFGGRILKNEPKKPKYVNSPETEVYHKSQILYGIFQAKQSILQADECYLVEGYTDVISLHQAGITHVVASSGTSLTIEQIRLIRRFTTHIVILYDGDEAGLKASLRGVDLILEEGMQVKIVFFPDKEDPDSYVKKVGATAFKEFIQQNSQDFIKFKTQVYLKDAQKDPFKRGEAIREVVTSITKIPDAIQRMIFFKECSHLFDVEESVLIAESNKMRLKESKPYDAPEPSQSQNTLLDKELEHINIDDVLPKTNTLVYQEQDIIRLLLNYGSFSLEEDYKLGQYLLAEISEITFETASYKKILEIFKKELAAGNIINANFFMHHPDEELQAVVIDLISEKYELSENWEKFEIYVPKEENNLNEVTFTHVLRLKFRVIQKMIEDNKKNLQKATQEEEQEKFLRIHMHLKETEKTIAQLLGNVCR